MTNLERDRAKVSKYFEDFPYATITDLNMRAPPALTVSEAQDLAETAGTLVPNECRVLYGISCFKRQPQKRSNNGENQNQTQWR